MNMIYDFFYHPGERKLYLEIWKLNNDDSTEYLWGIAVNSIGEGFEYVERYTQNGNRMMRG